MKANNRSSFRAMLVIALIIVITIAAKQLQADSGNCGGTTISLPFTDVPASNIFFCSIASAFITGLTNGTTATTYSPSANVPREQMAAFVSRTLDQSLHRGNQRAALGQWWTSQNLAGHNVKTTSAGPQFITSDGTDLWVSCSTGNKIQRFRGSDGLLLGFPLELSPNSAKGYSVGCRLYLVSWHSRRQRRSSSSC